MESRIKHSKYKQLFKEFCLKGINEEIRRSRFTNKILFVLGAKWGIAAGPAWNKQKGMRCRRQEEELDVLWIRTTHPRRGERHLCEHRCRKRESSSGTSTP